MFTKSARFYDAVYSFKDYAAEAAKVDALIKERNPRARTLLDVACGTGMHLEHLRGRYDAEGLDLDPELLAIARERLPGIRLHEADMIEFDLARLFDAVTCLFSSIGYARTVKNLNRAVAAMALHLEPGGVPARVGVAPVGPERAPEQPPGDARQAAAGLRVERLEDLEKDFLGQIEGVLTAADHARDVCDHARLVAPDEMLEQTLLAPEDPGDELGVVGAFGFGSVWLGSAQGVRSPALRGHVGRGWRERRLGYNPLPILANARTPPEEE